MNKDEATQLANAALTIYGTRHAGVTQRVNLTYASDGACTAMLQEIDRITISDGTPTYHWRDVRPLKVIREGNNTITVEYPPEGEKAEE